MREKELRHLYTNPPPLFAVIHGHRATTDSTILVFQLVQGSDT
jgi:hypothetical protein